MIAEVVMMFVVIVVVVEVVLAVGVVAVEVILVVAAVVAVTVVVKAMVWDGAVVDTLVRVVTIGMLINVADAVAIALEVVVSV